MATAPKSDNVQVMRSQLGRVRGLGPAKSGAHHWKIERITALALVPLSLWFVFSVLTHLGAPQPSVAAWAGTPLNAALLLALVIMTFHHMQLGLQVVWEDYIHHARRREALILATRGACLLLGLIAAVAIVKLAALTH
jgi:succinate dehydrogenase / fumarate reductase membrane anchor subunit